MDLNEYQKLASRTMNLKVDRKERLGEYTIGLNEEAGEAASPLKKYLYHGHQLNYDKLIIELGDVLWHIAAIAEEFDINLDYIAKENIDKLKHRYPEGFSSEKSINREV